MTANEMAAQLLRETIQQQAVDAVSSTMPRLEAAIKSGAGNNKLSARLPEFQYQLEVRQTGTGLFIGSGQSLELLLTLSFQLRFSKVCF